MKCAAVFIFVSLALALQTFAVLRPLFPVKPEPPFGGEAIIVGNGSVEHSAKQPPATAPK